MYKLFKVRNGYTLFIKFCSTRQEAETFARIDEKLHGKASYKIQPIHHENVMFSKLTGGR